MKVEYKAAPSKQGSIKEVSISPMEWIEYRQTGMIKVKETPISRGELQRLRSHRNLSYYDFAYSRERLVDFFDFM